MTARDVLPAGTMLDGKYRIDRLIGAGGFGMTYEAHDIGLNMRVAVKEYYPASFGARDGTLTVRPRTEGDVELFQRLKDSFLREARTLAQLRHPCIVRVLSVFEGHGTAYMIMEYESGQSLKGWLEKLGRRPSQGELDRLVMPLLDALEIIHGEGFLHRDIAPDNIIVRADGTPVLLDFGAARRVMAELSGALTGIVKSGYSPQEQYANDPRAQGPWSDIYALGATLYKAVSGKTPDEATIRMLDDPIEPATKVGAGVYRAEFLAAIDRAMSLRPKDRPQSIAELRRELSDNSRTRAVDGSRSALQATAVATGSSRTGDGWDRIAAPAPTRPAEDKSWRLAAALVAGIVLLAGTGWLAYDYRVRQQAETARVEIERQRREAEARGDADRRRLDEIERQRQADQQQRAAVEAEQKRARDEAERRRLALEAEQRKLAEVEQQKREEAARSQPAPGASGLAAKLEETFGPCPFCDDVKKLVTEEEFAQLKGLPAMIDRTIGEVINRRGPREDARARTLMEQLIKIDLEPDPLAAIKAGPVKCTTYNFGFLDNAAERVGQHQCMVRMVLIGGELTSLTIEKTTGDGFHANIKKFRVNALAYLGRTYLKGHAVTRYNQARPRNPENRNFGNKVGLVVSIGGRPALITMDQTGFTEPDPTFFEITLLEP